AQVVRDREGKEQYPLAILLEAFQSIQRKGARFILLLTGLPTLFPKLVESRTYAERMFAVLEIGRLSPQASRDAIEVPQKESRWKFTEDGVKKIIEVSDGYPYFIQFVCRETFDHLIANPNDLAIPIDAIVRKLDSDFFAGRWENVTDRQRDLLYCIAQLDHADEEFTISEIVDVSKGLGIKPFVYGDVSQALPRLIEKGLIYKNRHGKYCFAVPLFSGFIRRRFQMPDAQKRLFE
ncbi:MAG: ATP-binding protein, partial [Pirellulaceae bacterium]|nr:ATP-binding protein [Pirellulaceae bacterium]